MCINPDDIPVLAEIGDHFLEAGHKVMVLGDVDIILGVKGVILQIDNDQGLSGLEARNA